MTTPIRADDNLTKLLGAAMTSWEEGRCTERVWAKDASLWTSSGEERWLGWLDAVEAAAATADALERTVRAAAPAGVRDVLL
ncbi:MAG TPA: hypothetical protein VE967_14295, partial [Gemmatimonadaceae bacterium]|nr:hypothetical protein [Gemmatimonadaceae bacterium]